MIRGTTERAAAGNIPITHTTSSITDKGVSVQALVKRGVVFWQCNNALNGAVSMLATAMKMEVPAVVPTRVSETAELRNPITAVNYNGTDEHLSCLRSPAELTPGRATQ